ncbi:MAG: Hpt domain-containing protein [Deltaproteobacteria bacterium]|jgi:chemotaxis protein histidine kinase CheA|nr:Hpt domain-containing protein [Deltaproteobacteria bacterium]
MASELLDEFIFDSRDHLTTAGTQLMALEKEPDSLESLNSLMGTLHTIKGNSGFVNLRNLYEMLHGAENLLQTVRDTPGHVCPPAIINQLFQVLDSVEAILSRLEAGDDDQVDWLAALNQAIKEAEASLVAPMGEEPLASQAVGPGPATEAPKAPSAGADPAPAKDPPPAPRPSPRAEPQAAPGLSSEQTTRIDYLEDGELAAEGSNYLTFLKMGRGNLILDVNSLTSLGFDEIRAIRELVIQDDERFALVLDQNKQPDFWRVLVLWSLENKIKIFPSLGQAKAALTI